MNLKHKKLPAAPVANAPAGVSCEIADSVLAKWNPALRPAAKADAPSTITIFDPVGFDPWSGEGVTASRIAAALRSIGKGNPVDVLINSPGGDVFEGLAIYNLLREHDGEVRVKVIGLAASIASIIAMAGDEVQIARSGFLMIHNSWVVAGGNRHDLRAVADTLEPFDEALAGVYVARTGMDAKQVAKMMDSETWINGESAVAQGFASALLDADELSSDDNGTKNGLPAVREAERRLQASGLSRAQASRLVAELRGGKRDAADPGARDAAQVTVDPEVAAALRELQSTLDQFKL